MKNKYIYPLNNMENEQLLKEVTSKAQAWLGNDYDEETRTEVKRMLGADDRANRKFLQRP